MGTSIARLPHTTHRADAFTHSPFLDFFLSRRKTPKESSGRGR
jgi:hypothetical protein